MMKFVAPLLLVVAMSVLTCCFCMTSQKKRVNAIDAVQMEYISHHDDDPDWAIATADKMLEIMDNNIIDYRPYAMKGDAYVWTGRLEEAQECFMKALKAINDPSLAKSLFRTPASVEGDRMLIEKRITYLKAGKIWKNGREFRDLLRADIEQNRQKGRAGK